MIQEHLSGKIDEFNLGFDERIDRSICCFMNYYVDWMKTVPSFSLLSKKLKGIFGVNIFDERLSEMNDYDMFYGVGAKDFQKTFVEFMKKAQ